ncbi:MAG: carboxylating nicotinate-nucleotide diphosphorylase [Pirellulales bacterium]
MKRTVDFHQIDWNEQVADDCRQLVRLAVREDLDRGHDWTTVALVPAEAQGRAAVVARERAVVAGLPAAELVLAEMDRHVLWHPHVRDGEKVSAGETVAVLSGPARSLLTCERIVLNFLTRLSGIATLTERFVAAVAGTQARIYDTRKTTPAWRRLEKYAVRCGGGRNHRTGLFDAVLIKDNHLALGQHASSRASGGAFSAADAVRTTREFVRETTGSETPGTQMIVEVEVDTLDQLAEVLPAGPDIVLLDNMGLADLSAAVELRDKLARDVELEASGGVTLATVGAIARTGVERISVGALTHSVAHCDLGLDWLG